MHKNKNLLSFIFIMVCHVIFESGSVKAQIPFPGGCDPKIQSCVTPVVPPGVGPGNCGPSPGGPTCDGSGPATQGTGNLINVGAGNPINVLTGNKFQREVDMAPLPGLLGLEVVRYYNSAHSRSHHPNGVVGRGWKLSYETELHVRGRTLQITQADGARIIFSRNAKDPDTCSSASPADGTVRVKNNGGREEYTWAWTNGRELSFNANGKLVQIRSASGEFVSLQYDSRGMLLRVTDPQGRTMRLRYLQATEARQTKRFRGVQQIDTPVGSFKFSYGGNLPTGSAFDKSTVIANLVKVGLEGGTTSRVYHYEDAAFPTLLTGISLKGYRNSPKEKIQRLSTYAYDGTGKGTLSVRGRPGKSGSSVEAGGPKTPGTVEGVERISLKTGSDGATIVTNSTGGETVYQRAIIAGQYRLMEVRGSGCATCGPTNVRFAYDDVGQLTSTFKLNNAGYVASEDRITLDNSGRTTKVSSVDFRQGRAVSERWHVKYEYAGNGQHPTRVRRPSVMPNKEVIVDFEYNEHGQVLSSREQGWDPAGNESETPSAIERTAEYKYSVINGRSLLTQLDRPIIGPAGTKQGNFRTTFKYDVEGRYPAEVKAPNGSAVNILSRDSAGRVKVFETTDPETGRERIELFYNRDNLLTRVTRLIQARDSEEKGGRFARLKDLAGSLFGHKHPSSISEPVMVMSIAYDGFSRPTRITKHDSTWVEVRYDDLGRVVEQRDQDGNSIGFELSSEGALLEWSVQSARQVGEKSRRYKYVYSPMGQILELAADGGNRINVEQKPVASVSSALSRQQDAKESYRWDEAGRLTHVSQSLNGRQLLSAEMNYGAIQALTLPGGIVARRAIDDFGRLTLDSTPDNGLQWARYDSLDRLVEQEDANGNVTSYSYDAAGRVVSKQTRGKDSRGIADAERVHYAYQGRRVVEISNDRQKSSYTYDREGRMLSRADRITSTSVPGHSATPPVELKTTFTYDAHGRLTARRLATGEQLRFSYNSAGLSGISLTDATGQNERPLVQDIRQDRTHGVEAFRHGNGLKVQYERDHRTGRLERLSVSADGRPAPSAVWRGASPVYMEQVSYDSSGQVEKRRFTQNGGARTEQYSYDQFGHLSSVYDGQKTVEWTYDSAGNRKSASAGGLAPPFWQANYYPATNRIRTVKSGTEESTYHFDSVGNPVRIGATEYVYNASGRLKSVRRGGEDVAAYFYNAEGIRNAKVSREGSTSRLQYFVYTNEQLDTEVDVSRRTTSSYIYLEGIPVVKIEHNCLPVSHEKNNSIATPWKALIKLGSASRSAAKPCVSNILAIHSGSLGLPQVVTNEQADIVWQASYSPFGSARVATQTAELNLRFPGQYYDKETGSHYNLHRNYDPTTGRYREADRIGLGGGINPYSYVGQDPLRYVDPSGLSRLVMGFEVNNPQAFVGGIQDLNEDYGHAFFYLVDDNNKIEEVFSFGPAGMLTKRGMIFGVLGTPNYSIGAPSSDVSFPPAGTRPRRSEPGHRIVTNNNAGHAWAIPESVEFEWKEWPLTVPQELKDKGDLESGRAYVDEVRGRVQRKRAQIVVRGRIPPDVIAEVLQTEQAARLGQSVAGSLKLFFIFMPDGLRFRWEQWSGKCIKKYGGDEIDLPQDKLLSGDWICGEP